MKPLSVIEQLTMDVQSAPMDHRLHDTIHHKVHILAKYWSARTSVLKSRYQKQNAASVMDMFKKEGAKLKASMVEREWVQWREGLDERLNGAGKDKAKDKREKAGLIKAHATDVCHIEAVFGKRIALILAEADILGTYRLPNGPEHVMATLIAYLDLSQEKDGVADDASPAIESERQVDGCEPSVGAMQISQISRITEGATRVPAVQPPQEHDSGHSTIDQDAIQVYPVLSPPEHLFRHSTIIEEPTQVLATQSPQENASRNLTIIEDAAQISAVQSPQEQTSGHSTIIEDPTQVLAVQSPQEHASRPSTTTEDALPISAVESPQEHTSGHSNTRLLLDEDLPHPAKRLCTIYPLDLPDAAKITQLLSGVPQSWVKYW
ncbi:hypothetical protein N0V90_012837 [Kalmusia sp. IMI 367209]|nr:hypothetical protein N0V90_012837 [Kalmusia sp. IMI 367209]